VRFVYEFGLFPLRKGGATIDQFVAVEDYFEFAHLFQDLPEWRSIGHAHDKREVPVHRAARV
jgi:hypothetical protein